MIPWAGSSAKTAELLRTIIMLEKWDRYIEPFFGSGSVFEALVPQSAFISDIEPRLIDMYVSVQKEPAVFVKHLKEHKPEKEYFYKLRNRIDQLETTAQRGAAFYFLMVLAYNGVFKRRPDGIKIYWGDRYKKWFSGFDGHVRNIYRWHWLLKETTIHMCTYQAVKSIATKYDITFFDPPYYDTPADYGRVFDPEQFVTDIADWPGKWLLTINDTEPFRDLAVWVKDLSIYYSVSHTAEGRSERKEYVIANFHPRAFD